MQVRIETEINAPAETVWNILAHQFGNIADWSPIVKESHVIDATEVPAGYVTAPNAPVPGRSTTTKVATLKEIITAYHEEKMELTFQGAGLPPIFSFADDKQSVLAIGPDKCVVAFDIRMEPRGPFKLLNPVLKRRFTSTMGGVQRDLKRFAENGKVVS